MASRDPHGGQLLAKALVDHGVDMAFTVCGSHLQAVFDGFHEHGIRLVDVRHQQSAGFAAEAYARLTQRTGVVLTSAGSGLTNVVTAAANAKASGSPWLCIATGCPLALREKGALHEMNSLPLMSSTTKWCARITEVSRIAEYVAIALRNAMAGTPGPVYLELPADVLLARAPAPSVAEAPWISPCGPAAPREVVDTAALWLEQAARPCLILGSQIAFSPARSRAARILKQLGLATCLNGMARGLLPAGSSPLLVHARPRALKESDLFLVLGTPFDFRLGFGRAPQWSADAKVIQVDLSAHVLGQNRSAALTSVADAGLFLEQLVERYAPGEAHAWEQELRTTERTQAQQLKSQLEADPTPIARFARVLQRHLHTSDVIAAEAGAFVGEMSRWLDLRDGQSWLDAGPFGAPGTGAGFAVAASYARPNSRIVWLTGDGALGFSAGELEMLVRHQVHLLMIVGSNAGYSLFRASMQSRFPQAANVANQLLPTRYDQVAAAYGGRGYYVEDEQSLEDALFQAQEPGVHCIQLDLTASPP